MPDACEAPPGRVELTPLCFVSQNNPSSVTLIAALNATGLELCGPP